LKPVRGGRHQFLVIYHPWERQRVGSLRVAGVLKHFKCAEALKAGSWQDLGNKAGYAERAGGNPNRAGTGQADGGFTKKLSY
jgi:hypothetical protein